MDNSLFPKYHYIGPVGMFYMTTQKVPNPNSQINITYEDLCKDFYHIELHTERAKVWNKPNFARS